MRFECTIFTTKCVHKIFLNRTYSDVFNRLTWMCIRVASSTDATMWSSAFVYIISNLVHSSFISSAA